MGELFSHMKGYDVQATRAKARAEGVEAGKKEAREDAIAKLVRRLKKHSYTKEEVMADVMEDYELTESEAAEKVELYWD